MIVSEAGGSTGVPPTLGNELAGKGVIVNALTPETFESPILVQLPPSRVE
jgi:3-oxoacyl-[acyl-carrier protein] reductase